MIQISNLGKPLSFLSSPDTHFKTEGEYHVKLQVKSDAQEDIKNPGSYFKRSS